MMNLCRKNHLLPSVGTQLSDTSMEICSVPVCVEIPSKQQQSSVPNIEMLSEDLAHFRKKMKEQN